MEIKELISKPIIDQNNKLLNAFVKLKNLLSELRERELPEEIINNINSLIDHLNAVSESEREVRKQIRRTQSSILKLLEKELKLVPKNHYRNTWLALGMTVFGIPLGVAFGVSSNNMGFIGIGLPIGMVIGMAVGAGMDKKAFEAGKQLDWE